MDQPFVIRSTTHCYFFQLLLVGITVCALFPAKAQEAPKDLPSANNTLANRIYIREFQVTGAHHLTVMEIEKAVYQWEGPERTPEDVENARAALERAYQDKGYQNVLVEIPAQQSRGGIVRLQVQEQKVGQLRVNGAHYFLPSRIREKAPSLAEGTVINFNEVTRDIMALNKWPDRRVVPSMAAGKEPGTVDVNLTVIETPPIHGSLELNNRYSADTTPLRIDASLSYSNLWQAGHTLGGSLQISPEDLSQVKVFSGYYLARFSSLDWLSVVLQGTKQNSNVSTLGSMAVAGMGEVVGLRALVSLPPLTNFNHSLSAGFDYKHYNQDVITAGVPGSTPVTYYPVSVDYSGAWTPKNSTTELNVGVTFGLRGLGSDVAEFDNTRYKADGAFIYLRGDLSHTHELPAGFQAYGKVQGQVANKPLVSNEQFGGGGLGSARGYLEAEALGDNALFGSLELRTPSLLGWLHQLSNEWRFYIFADAGILTLRDPLPDQDSRFNLASVGVGSRLRLLDHFNGSLDVGEPLIGLTQTQPHNLLLTFRVWGEF